ncbi:MAG: hypothetical protein ACI9S8_002605 [Chlamydiales bacterium]|jgi:hypothetical protein
MPLDFNYQFHKFFSKNDMRLRDRFQFELKSEFTADSKFRKTRYVQDYYLFIPETLQINRETYSKAQFYQDQTNYIRFKTPVFTLQDLLDPKKRSSPLNHLQKLLATGRGCLEMKCLIDEMKLFGNVARSSLREEVVSILSQMELVSILSQMIEIDLEKKMEQIASLLSKFVDETRALYTSTEEIVQLVDKELGNPELLENIGYSKEFILRSIDFYCTMLLKRVRELNQDGAISELGQCDQSLVLLIRDSSEFRSEVVNDRDAGKAEGFHFRRTLLNNYMLEVLAIRIAKRAVEASYSQYVGALAAGFAMFVYLTLFIWKSNYLVINSMPFVFASVVLYILKDRLKEAVKLAWQRQAGKWFPDYSLNLVEPKSEMSLGELNEHVSFMEMNRLPDEIIKMRNKEFHNTLERFRRPENVLYVRKELIIKDIKDSANKRRVELNTFLRLNVQRFLEKMSEPELPYQILDTASQEIITVKLPKVYHIDIIISDRLKSVGNGRTQGCQLRKFRLILDKNGIKRVETF